MALCFVLFNLEVEKAFSGLGLSNIELKKAFSGLGLSNLQLEKALNGLLMYFLKLRTAATECCRLWHIVLNAKMHLVFEDAIKTVLAFLFHICLIFD